MGKWIVFFPDILVKQHVYKYRYQCQRKNQRTKKRKSKGIRQGGKKLAFHFLKRENRQERCYKDHFGKENGFGEFSPFSLDHTHFCQLIKALHTMGFGLLIEHYKQTLHHYDGTIN